MADFVTKLKPSSSFWKEKDRFNPDFIKYPPVPLSSAIDAINRIEGDVSEEDALI